MKRKRVGGAEDDELPADEEVVMAIPRPPHRAAVEAVGGQRVVRIYGIADVRSVLYHEDDYANVSHFAVLRLCLNDASDMVCRLVEIKTTRRVAMRISNAPTLLQASALRSAISRLSEDLSHLHQGLRNNRIIWELVSHVVRAMPALPLDLQPVILRDGILNLVEGVRATLTAFPAEPAGRYAGPNTIPATSDAADEVYTDLAARVNVHLHAMDSLLADSVDYPDVPPALFVTLDVEQLEQEVVYNRIRGLDHLRLVLNLRRQGPLTEFCVSQLYLGDADDMLQELTAAMEEPSLYRFANFHRVEGACEIKNMVNNMSETLQKIANGLIAGQIDPANIEILEDLESNFLKPVMGQCQTGAFRDAAMALHASLMELIDAPMDAGQGGAAPAGLVAVLTPLVQRSLQQVGSIWGISIEYADESLPAEVLQAQTLLDD